jgi:hypothetical protein
MSDIYYSRLQAIANEFKRMETIARTATIRVAHLEALLEVQNQRMRVIESLLQGGFQGDLVQRVQHELEMLRNTPERLQAANDDAKDLINRVKK